MDTRLQFPRSDWPFSLGPQENSALLKHLRQRAFSGVEFYDATKSITVAGEEFHAFKLDGSKTWNAGSYYRASIAPFGMSLQIRSEV